MQRNTSGGNNNSNNRGYQNITMEEHNKQQNMRDIVINHCHGDRLTEKDEGMIQIHYQNVN